MVAKNTLRFRETLRETSEQWCERNGIPPGFSVTFERADGRQVRDDVGIHRRVLPKKAPDDMNLKAALDDLAAIFVTDIEQRRWTPKLRAPDRTILNGNCRMSTIRAMDSVGKTVEEAMFRRHERDEAIAACEQQFDGASASLELGDCLDAPEICRGALRALLKAHGKAAVRRAAEAEGLI